ncbi:hypothetical protein DIPPA_23437 [Diplonema papillatum]|nr:hypothetical protein DIPPA_23437 [Diplonema papillatum]
MAMNSEALNGKLLPRAATSTRMGMLFGGDAQQEEPDQRALEEDPLLIVNALFRRIATAPPPLEEDEARSRGKPAAPSSAATTDDMMKAPPVPRKPDVPNVRQWTAGPPGYDGRSSGFGAQKGWFPTSYTANFSRESTTSTRVDFNELRQQQESKLAAQQAIQFVEQQSREVYQVGNRVKVISPITFDMQDGAEGVVQIGCRASVSAVPGEDEGSIAEIALDDGRKVDVFPNEIELIPVEATVFAAALVIVRSEAIISSYQSTILRRLERVRQQVVADFEATLLLRPPGLELLPQKGREEAFRLHVDNTYTSNMKAVLHDRYKKMYGKAYIEIVGPSDPTPDQKKGRKIGAAAVAAAVTVMCYSLSLDCLPYEPVQAPVKSGRRQRNGRSRRPLLAMTAQAPTA